MTNQESDNPGLPAQLVGNSTQVSPHLHQLFIVSVGETHKGRGLVGRQLSDASNFVSFLSFLSPPSFLQETMFQYGVGLEVTDYSPQAFNNYQKEGEGGKGRDREGRREEGRDEGRRPSVLMVQ